jgi:uncharacterized protein
MPGSEMATPGMSPADAPAAGPRIGFGWVRHHRLRPVDHAFAYPGCFLLLPMRALARQPAPPLRRNRRAWFSFHDRDHGDGGPDALAWIESRLRAAGIDGVDGEIWLQTFPRLLGHVFKPVSFWYCLARDGRLVAVLTEVNNTFGQRHVYLLHGPELAWGREQRTGKCLHVSPFNQVEGGYRMRFLMARAETAAMTATAAVGDPVAAARHCVVRIDHDDAQGEVLRTSQSGALRALDAAALRHLAWHMPWHALAVTWRIHWQALRLALKGVRFFGTDGHARARRSAGT